MAWASASGRAAIWRKTSGQIDAHSSAPRKTGQARLVGPHEQPALAVQGRLQHVASFMDALEARAVADGIGQRFRVLRRQS